MRFPGWRGARRIGELFPYAAILLASGILFAPFLLRGQVFFPADTLLTTYPWKAQAPRDFRPHNKFITDPVSHNNAAIYNRQLHEGGLRNWNPFILTGLPATGATALSGMSGRYHPLKLLLHRLFSAPVALSLLLLTHVTLMGLTMHAYLRAVGAGRRGALFGAIAYQFNGSAMAWLEYETQVAAFALFPLLLLCMERYLGRRRWLHAFAGAAALALFNLMGHLQYLFYGLLMMTAYLLFLLLRLRRRGAAPREGLEVALCFGVTCAGGLLAGGVELLPLGELLQQSHRLAASYATFGDLFAGTGQVHFRSLVTLVFPDYFGNPVTSLNFLPGLASQGYNSSYSEMALNVGIPTLFALLACTVSPPNRQARFFLLATLLAALLMTGTFLYRPFFALVPGMDRLPPHRIIWLFTFSAIAAASLGVRRLGRLRGGGRRAYLGLTLLLAAAILALALASTAPAALRFFNAEAFRYAAAAEPDWLPAIVDLRRFSSPAILRPLLLALGAAPLFAFLAVRGRRAGTGLAFAVVLGLLAFELIGAAKRFNTVVAPAAAHPSTPAIDFLRRQEKPFRVVQHGSTEYSNQLALRGLEEAGGYSSFYPARTRSVLSFAEYGAAPPTGNDFERTARFYALESRLFDLLNVRYVLVPRFAPLAPPRWKLVYRGEMDVFENLHALPRAFAVHRTVRYRDDREALAAMAAPDFDFRSQAVVAGGDDPVFLAGAREPGTPPRVSVEEHTEDEVVLAADLAANGWVVLSDAWYPGWKAYVDGVETPILRANVNFRAVPVRAGKHGVTFRYEPASLRTGKLLTLLGTVFTLGGMLWFGGRARRRPAATSPGAGP